MTSNPSLREDIVRFLDSYQLMAIATVGDHPWIANVYYAVDADLSLYFLTDPATMHAQHISHNPLVSCAIYDSSQSPVKTGEFVKIGLQLYGTASQVTDEAAVRAGLELWKRTLHLETDAKFTYERMLTGELKSRVYKVTPKRIKLFHEQRLKEGKEIVLDL